MGLDRPRPGIDDADKAAADEALSRMVEIVTVIVVDDHPQGAGADERVDQFVVVEDVDRRGYLIGVVLADHSSAGGGIIGPADAGQQH